MCPKLLKTQLPMFWPSYDTVCIILKMTWLPWIWYSEWEGTVKLADRELVVVI